MILISCKKDNHAPNDSKESEFIENQVTNRSVSHLADSLWQLPTEEQLNGVWKDMMLKADVNEIGSFLYQYGFLDWSHARLIQERDNRFVISIPTIEEGLISSILFVEKIDDKHHYWHLSLKDLQVETPKLIEKYGPRNTLFAVVEFMKQEQFYGNYVHDFLLDHFYQETIQGEIVERSRGWCLVEIILFEISRDGTYESPTTGWTYTNCYI